MVSLYLTDCNSVVIVDLLQYFYSGPIIMVVLY